MDLSQVLKDGQILYYYYYSPGKISSSYKYGLCALLKENLESKMVILDELKVKYLDSSDNKYSFYSELSEIKSNERSYYIAGIKSISDKAVRELLPYLLTRDWTSHFPRNPFTSIGAFLHHIISLSANSTMIEMLTDQPSIDWGYVDNKRNSFIHAACLLQKNHDLAQVIITKTISQDLKNKLINSCNMDNLTPLALCIRGKNPTALLIDLLAKNGATLTLPKGHIRELILNDKFSIGYENKELILMYEFLEPGIIYGNNVAGYICFNLEALDHCQIFKKVQKDLKILSQILKEKFNVLLQTNCPQLLDYVFNPANHLISKLDRDINGNSILHIAVRNATPVILQHILNGVTNWGIVNDAKDNLLHTSIRCENFDNLNVLLNTIPTYRLKKLMNTPNDGNMVPFDMMINEPRSYGSISIALGKGCVDEKGNNFIHIAIEKRKFQCLQYLVRNSDKNFALSKNSLGFTPLELAITKSCVDSVKLLLECSIELLDHENRLGCNHLHSSIIHYNFTIFKMILAEVLKFAKDRFENKLINRNTRYTKEEHSYNNCPTPFLLSIQLNKFDATELLVSEGADIGISDNHSKNVFYYLLKYCQTQDSLTRLLNLDINERNYLGLKQTAKIQDVEIKQNSILFFFYQNGDFDSFTRCFEALSLNNQFRVNTEGYTILQTVLNINDDQIIEYLFLKLSKLFQTNAKDVIKFINSVSLQEGETALSQAVQNLMHSYVKKILNLGADIHTIYPPNKNTILHIAISTNDPEMIRILLNRPEMKKLFGEKNDRGEAPIVQLIKSGDGGVTTNIKDIEGGVLLHYAVQIHDTSIQNSLFEQIKISSEMKVKAKDGKTPFHHAIIFKNINAIRTLIDHHVDILAPDDVGKTSIHLTIDVKNEEIWTLIFQNLSTKVEIVDERCFDDINIFQYSILQNFLPAVRDILTLKPNLFPSHPKNNTIIHLAAENPELTILSYLLNGIKSDDLNKLLQSANMRQLPPLHYAISCNNIQALRIFEAYDKGKDNLQIAVPFKGKLTFFSPIFKDKLFLGKYFPSHVSREAKFLFGYKVESSNEKVLILTDIPELKTTKIYQPSSVQEVQEVNEDELAQLVRVISTDIIKYTIEKKIIDHHSRFSNGATLLHLAAQFGSCQVLNYFLTRLEVLTLDRERNSIVYYALQNNIDEVFQLICEHVFDSCQGKKTFNFFDIPNSKGKRLLDICLEMDKLAPFEILLLEKFKVELIYTDEDGSTLLHKIIQSQFCEKLISPFLKSLKERHDPNTIGDYLNKYITVGEGYNALHLVILKNKTFLLSILVDKFKDYFLFLINSQTNETGLTPLHLASRSEDLEMIRILLENDAKPNIRNCEGKTPLHYAASDKNQTDKLIVMLLNSCSALITVKDNRGRTPIFYAVTEHNVVAFKTLIARDINLLDTDNDGITIIQLSIEMKENEIWKFLFSKLKASKSRENLSALDLFNLIQYSMTKKNSIAFTDLLSLTNLIKITDTHFIELIATLIGSNSHYSFLETLIAHVKKVPNYIDCFFCPKSLYFEPPLQLAIRKSNNSAIRVLLKENIPLAFPIEGGQTSLYSQNNRETLIMCQHITKSNLLIGYKIQSDTPASFSYLLVTLPDLTNTFLYNSREVLVLDNLNKDNIIKLLQCNSIEPINSQMPKVKMIPSIEIIYLAAEHGSNLVLNFLLSNPDNIKFVLKQILFFAILNKNKESFKMVCNFLVKKKAFDVFNATNHENKRIIEVCLEKDDYYLFCFLLESEFKVVLSFIDAKGYTLFHKLVLLKRDQKFLKVFDKAFPHESCSKKKFIDYPAGQSKLTALHLAILENQPDLIDFMLQENYDANAKTNCGNTPLHLTILCNSLDITKSIFKAISNKLLINEQNKDGFTPLHIAIQNANIEIIKLLLDERTIRLDLCDVQGRSVIHHAVLIQEIDLSTQILSLFLRKSNLFQIKDKQGQTALHYSVIHNNLNALNLLLENCDYSILFIRDESEKTIFNYSIEIKTVPIWKAIFEELKQCRKSDVNSFKTSLLVYSIEQNNLTAFQDVLLLNPDLNATDVKGNTPLHLTVLSPDTQQILDSLLKYLGEHQHEKIQDIICSQNNDHLAPFHLAISRNNIPAIEIFLKYKIPLVFYDKLSHQLTICSKNSPLTLHLCQNIQNKLLYIGYKIVDQVSTNKIISWILTEIPELNYKAIKYGSREINEIHTVSESQLQNILKYPSPEPILTFLHTKLIPETLQFTNNCSILHLAAKFGSIEVVSELCKSMKLEELDQNMDSVLFYALENGNIKILQFLLTKISENTSKTPSIINGENASGKRIIEVAIDKDHFEAFECLLKRGFQVELTYRNKNGLTLLHKIIQDKKETKFFQALLEEIKARNLELLTEYINSPKHSSNETALHLCLRYEQKGMLNILLNLNPNFSCENENKDTPLHCAINLNFCVDLIINSIKKLDGDNLSLINAVNNKKLTPLHLAIINHDQPNTELLLNEKANLYAIDTERKSMLHYAVEIKDEIPCQIVIKFLFQYERNHPSPDNNLLHMQDNAGSTALHMTVKKSKTSTTKLLIQQSPNLKLKDDEGKTVLHHSVCNDPSIVDLLIEYTVKSGKQAINMQDFQGNTPLHLAIKLERNDSLKKLLAINPALDLKNELGLTPLHLAVLKSEQVLDQVLQAIELQSSDICHYLYALNDEGIPPLHYAILNASNIALIRKLVGKGAKLMCQDNTGVITLFDGKGGLNLCIVKQTKYELKNKYVPQVVTNFGQKIIGYNKFIGYRARLIPFWIVTDLHTLNDVKIEEDKSTIEEVILSLDYSDTVVANILRCESIDPIKMAIEKKLLNDREKDKEGGNKLLNYASENNGSIAVINFIKSTSLSLDEICSWIMKSVSNLKILRIIFESIPDNNYGSIIKDSSKLSGEDLKRNKIAIALSNALLSCLVKNKSIEIFTFLLSKNLCLNMQYGNDKDTLLHSMVKQCKSEDFLTLFLDKVKEYENNRNEKLLIDGEPLIDAQTSNSKTALALCILKNQEQNFKALLNCDPSLTLKDKSNNNILHYIAKTGNQAVADILFKISKKLECLFNAKNSEGCIPLHIAIENGHEKIAEMLLQQRSDLYSQDDASRTVLHHALLIQDQTTQSSMIKFILDYEKNNSSSPSKIVGLADKEGFIPLRYAIIQKSLPAVKLLAPYAFTLKHRDEEGQTALHIASMHDNSDIFNEIINQISKQEESIEGESWLDDRVLCYQDKQGRTALQLCIEYKSINALQSLLKKRPCLNLVDNEGNSLLHHAVANKDCQSILTIILRELKNRFSEYESYFYLTNNQGLPVLQYAIQKDNLIAVEFLIKEGVKLAFKNQNGEITFCHKRSNLELLIFNNKSKTSELYAGFPIKTRYVVTKLDNLEMNKPSLQESNIQQLNNATSLKKQCSKSIFRCNSSEPFEAISNLLKISDEIGNDSLIEFSGKHSSVRVINLFLDCFKIDVFQRCKITILESAILHNSDKGTIKEILKRLPLGGNLKIPERNVSDLNRDELISLCLYNSLQCSIEREDTEIFEELLKFGAKLDNPYGDNAGTILHFLTDKNTTNFVESLLKWLTILKNENKEVSVGGIPFIDAPNKLGETALLLFTSKELKPHIDCLLKYLPNLSRTDSEGNNALHLAARTDNFTILKLLVAYAIESNSKSLLDEKNTNGLTPLFIAIDMSNLDIAEHLISSGSSLLLIDESKRNVLHHIAILKNQRSKFIALLEREKVLPNLTRTQDIEGRTPLHLAIISQFRDTVGNLLKADPFTLTLIDSKERTALHYAAIGRDERIVELLIDTIQHEEESPHGLDWLQDRVICRQDFEKKTALHYSIVNMNSQILNLLLKTKPCLDLTDENKNSLLHYAVSKYRNDEYVALLLKELKERFPKSMPTYLYAENVDGIPPLQYAILNNNLKGAEKLIEYGANLAYETTHGGYTLCHGKEDLTIEFFQKQSQSTPQKRSKKFEYYVGIKKERNCDVVCLLPELEVTETMKPPKFELVEVFSDPFLFSILKSSSIEPFIAALNSKCEYFNINSKFKDGRYLKHFIAQYASRQVTDYFLTLFHEPVYYHEEGNKSMIEFAVLNKTDPATLQLLLKKAEACDVNNHEERNNCIESCISKSFESSLGDNATPDAFQDLLGFVSRIDYRYAQNNTLLHLTIENAKTPEFIRTLFTKVKELGNPLIEGVPFIDVQNSHMKTALYTCIELEKKENLETLLKYSPDFTIHDNFIRMNVLHLAAYKDLFEFVEILLKNSAAQGIINSQNCMGLTPLHFAAKNGNINMTKILLDHKANYLKTDNVDRNILHHAVAIGDLSKREAIVKFILGHKVAIQSHLESDATQEVAQDLSIMTTKEDNKGYTPLHLSVILQSFDAVKLLLDFDPKLLFQKNLIGHTPLHLSIIPQECIMDKSDPFSPTTKSDFHKEIFDEICEKINSQDKHGDSPCNKGNIICFQDSKQRAAMHYAIQYKRVQAFTKLLGTGSCLDIQDDEGNGLLHEAVKDPDDIICLDLLLAELDKRYKGAHLECFKF